MSDKEETGFSPEIKAVFDESARELPPLNESDKKDKKAPSAKVIKRNIKRSMMVIVALVVVVVVVSILYMKGSNIEQESSEAESEHVLEGEPLVDLNSFNPLLPETQEKTSLGVTSDLNDSVAFKEDEIGSLVLEEVMAELSETKNKVLEISNQLPEWQVVTEQVSLVESTLLGVVSKNELEVNRIAELEKNMTYLLKEVKRLKWIDRQKRVARKKVVTSSLKIKSFFVWQYRPGVEIEFKNITQRFYEGDLLDGMRLLKIDVHKERVTFTKNGKKVVMTLEEV